MGKARVAVLGASTGIGREAYEQLVNAQITGRREIEEVWGCGLEGSPLPIDEDATDIGSIEQMDIFDSAKFARWMGLAQPTHLVYSIGVNELDWFGDITDEVFNRVMATNVLGFIQAVKVFAALHEKRVAEFGALEFCKPSIVAITSDAAWRPMRTSAVYCASKAALEMVVRVASREYAPYGWRINAVAPGKVANTPMTEYVDRRVLELRGWTEEYARAYESASSAIGRAVTKQEVAAVIEGVLFGPIGMTGEIVAVNGGR